MSQSGAALTLRLVANYCVPCILSPPTPTRVVTAYKREHLTNYVQIASTAMQPIPPSASVERIVLLSTDVDACVVSS